MSIFNNIGMNRKLSQINDTTAGLIIIIVVLLLAVVCIFGYNLLTETLKLENKDILLWLIFMLIAAAISILSDTIISIVSKKSKENNERSIVQEITDVFIKKSDEIKDEINVALKRSDLVSGNREDILRLLMNHSLLIGEISKIRILAHDSTAFQKFFTEYFKNVLFKNKKFKCKELEILIHDQNIGTDHDIIKKWYNFYNNKTIEILRIQRVAERRRSFFGMVIEFDMHYPIGLIGFYKPQDENSGNNVSVLNNPYGVFSEEGSSILCVLDAYINRYIDSDNITILREEQKKRPD